jgi:hypothetical protein
MSFQQLIKPKGAGCGTFRAKYLQHVIFRAFLSKASVNRRERVIQNKHRAANASSI